MYEVDLLDQNQKSLNGHLSDQRQKNPKWPSMHCNMEDPATVEGQRPESLL